MNLILLTNLASEQFYSQLHVHKKILNDCSDIKNELLDTNSQVTLVTIYSY